MGLGLRDGEKANMWCDKPASPTEKQSKWLFGRLVPNIGEEEDGRQAGLTEEEVRACVCGACFSRSVTSTYLTYLWTFYLRAVSLI